MLGKKYLGQTTDNTNRKVELFSDDETIYAVYNRGTEHEHIASENIAKILDEPDSFIYTPYIEFVNLF